MKGEIFGPGADELVRFLAKNCKFQCPDQQNNTFKTYTTTGYTYVYVPETFLQNKRVVAKTGVKSSSLVHQFGTSGDGRILTRQRWCGCTSCLESATLFADEAGKFRLGGPKCTLTEWVTESKCHSPTLDKQAKRSKPIRTTHINKTDDVPTVAGKLKIGQHVLVRIHPEDRTNGQAQPGEAYFVGKVIKREPWQIQNDGLFGAEGTVNMFKKNEWVARIQWYNLVETDDWGNRYYSLMRGPSDVISVNSFIRVGMRTEFKLERAANSRYMITSALHETIMKYSDETLYEVEKHEIERSSK